MTIIRKFFERLVTQIVLDDLVNNGPIAQRIRREMPEPRTRCRGPVEFSFKISEIDRQDLSFDGH
jgi:hypothetical protein